MLVLHQSQTTLVSCLCQCILYLLNVRDSIHHVDIPYTPTPYSPNGTPPYWNTSSSEESSEATPSVHQAQDSLTESTYSSSIGPSQPENQTEMCTPSVIVDSQEHSLACSAPDCDEDEQNISRAFDASLYRDPLPLHLIDLKLLEVADDQVRKLFKPTLALTALQSTSSKDGCTLSSMKRPFDDVSDHHRKPESPVKRRKVTKSAAFSRRSSRTKTDMIQETASLRRAKSLVPFVSSASSLLVPARSGGQRLVNNSHLSQAPRLLIKLPPPELKHEVARRRLTALRRRELLHRHHDCLPIEASVRLEPVSDGDTVWGCVPMHIRSDIMSWFYSVSVPSFGV